MSTEAGATTTGNSGTNGGQTTTAPATTTTTAPAPSAAPTDWTTGFSDDLKGYVQNKGFKGPQDILESYRNFEKLQGAPQDRILKLPEDLNSPEGKQVWERLGKPKEAKDYKIEIPKDYGDEKLAEELRVIADQNNFTHSQVEGLVKWWNERTGNTIKSMTEAQETARKNADQALRKEWGAAFDQNKNIVDNAARSLGLGEKEFQALGQALGPDGAMKMLLKLGKATGEADFVTTGPGGKGALLTPEQSKNEINALMSDPSFTKRLMSRDADAVRKWDNLHKMAFGGEVSL